jgi:hypothetical protein
MELIREFAMRWAAHPQMAEALRVDATTPQAGWVWALAVIRVWLSSGDTNGMASFVRRLEAGLLPDYGSASQLEGIPIEHHATTKDTIHDVLLWATGDANIALPVAIKTIIQHVCKRRV